MRTPARLQAVSLVLNTLEGTDGPDVILGTAGRDNIIGKGGDDDLDGRLGDDFLHGDAGDDRLQGGGGRDVLGGGAGDDVLFGGAGNDDFRMISFPDNPIVQGTDRMTGGDGHDVFSLRDGSVTASGDAGQDNFNVYLDSELTGSLTGGQGQDSAYVSCTTGEDVHVDVFGSSTRFEVGGELRLQISGIEGLAINAGDGDDLITTGDSNDQVFGGAGTNVISTGGGDDLVRSGGADSLDGGAGQDRLLVGLGPLGPREGAIFDAASGRLASGTTFGNFEAFDVEGSDKADRVILGGGNDSCYAAFGDDTVHGGVGDDILRGVWGHDSLFGGIGNDVLDGGEYNFGGADSLGDHLFGGGGDDLIYSQDGGDTLFGGGGRDRLGGGGGFDSLTGGAGADTFVIGWRDGGARIADFEAGRDGILVSDPGDDEFVLPAGLGHGPVDPALFHLDTPQGTGGQLVLLDLGADDKLIWDANGTDAGGEITIFILTGESGLTASDLVIA